jgi:hypothetical protein
MSFARRLETLDRRWIFLIVGLLVLIPLLWPVPLPLTVSPRVRGFADAIDAIPDGSTVLMSCDWDPGGKPEMQPMTRTALRHLFRKNCKVVITVLWNGGPGIVDETCRAVADEMGKKYGVDWIDLGYKAGNEAVMVLMGQSIPNTFPQDIRGGNTLDYPIMHGVKNYTSFPLLVSISSGYPGTKEYVQQVQGRFHIKMVAGVTAVSAPEFYPYLQSHQLLGLLGGMAGAAEYEKAQGESGDATKGMVPQSFAHLFVAFCILAGNAVQWMKAREKQS